MAPAEGDANPASLAEGVGDHDAHDHQRAPGVRALEVGEGHVLMAVEPPVHGLDEDGAQPEAKEDAGT